MLVDDDSEVVGANVEATLKDVVVGGGGMIEVIGADSEANVKADG